MNPFYSDSGRQESSFSATPSFAKESSGSTQNESPAKSKWSLDFQKKKNEVYFSLKTEIISHEAIKE